MAVSNLLDFVEFNCGMKRRERDKRDWINGLGLGFGLGSDYEAL